MHVVIIGLARAEQAPAERRLFSYEDINGEPFESVHRVLSPYLFDASQLANPHLVVRETGTALNGMPKLIIGSKPIDGGHYIFTPDERAAFVAEEPDAASLFRPFIGAEEFLNGGERYILLLADADPSRLKRMPKVLERIEAVRKVRLESKSAPTRELAKTPTLCHVNVIPDSPFLVVPEVSSERREYIPIGWLEPPVIPSNKVRLLANATLWQFAFLTSSMHMSWVRHIGGRLESRFQYGIGVVYNTLPLPPGGTAALEEVEPLAQAVLAARAAFPNATLADLYDPDTMPPALRKAHQALDRAVERLYRKAPFKTDRERAEHLLGLYEQMVSPLALGAAPAAPKRKRKS